MSSSYGVTLKQLRELMEFRGAEGVDKIREQGGVNELCKNLRTSEKSGEWISYHVIKLVYFE